MNSTDKEECYRCNKVIPNDSEDVRECDFCGEVFCSDACKKAHEKNGEKECYGMEWDETDNF
ncbi:MAG: hypothetical protein WC365_07590 [Candidatus Babeliales bacterium]